MAIPVKCLAVCDPKPLCQAWVLGARSALFSHAQHFYKDINGMATQGPCLWHPGRRACPIRQKSDFDFTGLPCQPFSMQRSGHARLPAQRHPAFQVMIDYLHWLDVSGLHGGCVENVSGFANTIKDTSFKATELIPCKPRSWVKWFVCQLQDRGFFVVSLKFDNYIFRDVPRPMTHCM